jgi:hypothetical protein
VGARGRGWALWKALITFAGNLDTDINAAATALRVISDVVAEHQRQSSARGCPP